MSDAGSPASYSAGPASYLEFTRNGHAFNFDNTSQDYSTGFVSQVGFIQTANIRSNQTHVSYQWFPKHSILQSFGLESSNSLAFDHNGNRVYHYTSGDPFFAFPRKIVVAPLVGENSDTLTPAQYPLLKAPRNLTENYGGFILKGAPLAELNFNIVFAHGGNPNIILLLAPSPSSCTRSLCRPL